MYNQQPFMGLVYYLGKLWPFSSGSHSTENPDSDVLLSTGTVVKVSALLLASSFFLFGLASVLRPVAPIIQELIGEDEDVEESEESERHLRDWRGHGCLLPPGTQSGSDDSSSSSSSSSSSTSSSGSTSSPGPSTHHTLPHHNPQ